MKKESAYKKSKLLPLLAFGVVITLTSCNLFETKTWKWEDSTSTGTINYCLLIGQLDHNDSMYRTRGVRQELYTRVEEARQKTNFNLEDVKQGEIELGDESKGVPKKKFKVNELEHLEQKSFSGATWDPITANGSAGTWISKHGSNITCFVSNNDGMAEGAIKAHNWPTGMPIFGYDANTSTLKLMLQDKIMGTIDSNTAAQCLASSILIRNIVNANKSGLIDAMAKDGKVYNPTGYGSGFASDTSTQEGGANRTYQTITYGDKTMIPYGKEGTHMISKVTLEGCDDKDFIDATENSIHAILLKNRTVTNDLYVGDEDGVETSKFFKEDGSPLNTQEKYNLSEGPDKAGHIEINDAKGVKKDKINIWQSWYSLTDTFFTGNMDPFFQLTQAEDMFNIDVNEARGDGADESKILNMLDSALAKGAPDAFLINPVQQPNSVQYIKKIAEKLNISEKESWFERSNIPVVFWNRQPTNLKGEISWDTVMNNKYFKYTYYVGFDAQQGGELQGDMVYAWLNKAYVENYKK